MVLVPGWQLLTADDDAERSDAEERRDVTAGERQRRSGV
jgi:hypothetical protein